MSKIKLGFSALLTLILLGMFAALASAEGFTATPSNPAPGINVGTVDNNGDANQHRTHGNFQNNTNSCGNCHSAHNGSNETLLKFQNSEPDMCLSCHDGTMGFYNVKTASGAGIFNSTHESASMHDVGKGIQIGSAPGAYANKSVGELECSSCHNPHGSVNDRLLSESVIGVSYSGVTKGTKSINLELKEDPAYADINNSSTMSGLKITTSVGPKGNTDKVNYAKFCGACHDDYLGSSGAPNHTNHYGHTTNSSSAGRNCASCHYAHGTDITMLKDTQGKTIADYVNGGWTQEKAEAYMKDVSVNSKGVKTSSLKKYTNMAVCWTCHQSSHAIDTQQPEDKYLTDGVDRYGNPIKLFKGKSDIR
ncbi:cytochrome c3 family protein [Neobacillus mesonae]|uniref:cytochrome c3 family protein n=1 Tax=Neobacillus mesonae TaxID=1193713 RepID=UPI00082B16BA|nr:cytochrome c3 family protein [Neobacillus mesonae]